ncbi:zinc finger, CCHC-type containing protein [Tanacetum coccineum]
MDEDIRVSCIIDKLPPSWKDFKHTLKHKKEESTLVELGSHIRIEESPMVQDSDKPKGNNVAGPSVVNMVENNNPIRAVVRLSDPKLKTLGERRIKCIFVGYVEHYKAFRFYVIGPNESVSINSIIESKDAIFDENKFSSVLRPSQRSLIKGTKDIGGSVVLEEVVVQQPEPELRKRKRNRTLKNFGPEFKLYLIEGTRDEKEATDDEMNSIMGNNTWMLANLPSVACISIIRLLIALASIHNLIIHQMDVNTTFLNGEMDEEVYMNQPQGFIMLSNENKVCKLIKSLYGLKQAPKQLHQNFDEAVLSSGYLFKEADKCVYSKFDESSKGVIICLYLDDMLIFDTNQVQADLM